MRMSTEMFKQYQANPLGMDAVVRNHFNVPDNRYYTVSMSAPTEGTVTVDKKRFRTPLVHKVSKSDQ